MQAVSSSSSLGGSAPPSPGSRPWWREPMVWLVIAGPVVVIIAGFITLGIAIRNPDPVVPDTAVRRSPTSASQLTGAPQDTGSSTRDPALMPAVQARNQGAGLNRPAP
jgi:uncharacterized protein